MAEKGESSHRNDCLPAFADVCWATSLQTLNSISSKIFVSNHLEWAQTTGKPQHEAEFDEHH